MSSKSKGSLVLALLLFLGSAPTWAASVEGRPNFADSSAISAFSDVVSGWLGSVLQTGRSTVKAIWGEYGIAIDPDGAPSDPSHAASAANSPTSTAL
jgi:hypothetical protein